MKLPLLNEAKIRYFLEDDMIDPPARKSRVPYKAYLVKVGNDNIWIPKSVCKQTKIVDTDTGELFDGLYVNEWWRQKHIDVAKDLKRSGTDYKNAEKDPYILL